MQQPPSQPLFQDEELLSRHRQFLCHTREFLEQQTANNMTHDKDLALLLLNQLKAHEKWLAAKSNGSNTVDEDEPIQWGPITSSRIPDSDKCKTVTISIIGPKEGDEHLTTADGEEEAILVENEVEDYNRMSQVLARAVSQASALFELRRPAAERHNDDTADRAKIALLKQYNNVRDVGQQLIGIVADNKGVPIRSLYEDGAYGVGSDD